MAYECQGIGIGATCGKPANHPVKTSGVGDDGKITDKTVWLCESHYTELDDIESKILDRINRGER